MGTVTRTWRVYGVPGHRLKNTFQPSYKDNFSNSEDGTRIIEVQNSDITGTNQYSVVKITRDTRELCWNEFWGQYNDGIFENSRARYFAEIISVYPEQGEKENENKPIECELADEVPISGSSFYQGLKVLKVTEVPVDPDQEFDGYAKYGVFELLLGPEDAIGPEEKESRYICVDRNVKSVYRRVLGFEDLLPPTLAEANILVAKYLDRCLYLKEEMAGLDEDRLIQDYFGLTEEKYQKLLVNVVGLGFVKCKSKTEDSDSMILIGVSGMHFLTKVPLWFDDDTGALIINLDDKRESVKEGVFPARHMKDLHPAVFSEIVDSCYEGADWMEAAGYEYWFDLISLNVDEVVEICSTLTTVCTAPFKKLLELGHLTQAEFSRRFHVGKGTVDSWASGQKPFKIYLRLMYAEAMGLIQRRSEN